MKYKEKKVDITLSPIAVTPIKRTLIGLNIAVGVDIIAAANYDKNSRVAVEPCSNIAH